MGIAPSDSFQSMSVSMAPNHHSNEIPSLDSFDIDGLIASKLEEKMSAMIAEKFSQIDEKLDALTNEIDAIKLAITEEAKNNKDAVEKAMKEINLVKDQMSKMQKNQAGTKKKKSTTKGPKLLQSASAKQVEHKMKN